jgi:predicted acylesterase/phospholipase RssA
VHDEGERIPRGTDVLLDQLPAGRHFHVRRGNAEDLRRVARQLAGAAVGLVLGGGGSRGFAHLGVIRALEEAAVPIDAVGGTSVGSLMGALVSWGLDHPERLERAHRFIDGRLTTPTLPIMAATSARRITQRLKGEDFAGNRDLADSWIPFFCVSTNLSTARPHVHVRGPAWQALRASISLPGMMPPVCTDDGELLVDGGLVDDLPIDVMAPLLDGGRTIAVDLGIRTDFRVGQPFNPSLSGWRVLGRRLNPVGPRFDGPSLLATLLRAKEVASHESLELKRQAHDVALLVRPPVAGVGGFDFRQVDDLVERSYRHTLDLLAQDPVATTLGRSSPHDGH